MREDGFGGADTHWRRKAQTFWVVGLGDLFFVHGVCMRLFSRANSGQRVLSCTDKWLVEKAFDCLAQSSICAL